MCKHERKADRHQRQEPANRTRLADEPSSIDGGTLQRVPRQLAGSIPRQLGPNLDGGGHHEIFEVLRAVKEMSLLEMATPG
jgi:hypothetical protein